MSRVYLGVALFHLAGEEISEWLVRGKKGNLSKVLSLKGLIDPSKGIPGICPVGNREFILFRILSQEGI